MNFDQIKGIFNSVVDADSEKGKEYAGTAAEKTKAAGRLAKLTMEMAGEKESLKSAYAAIGQKQKAMELYKQLWTKSEQYLNWYCSLNGMRFQSSQRECMTHLYILQQISLEANLIDAKWSDGKTKSLNALIKMYQNKGGHFGSEPAEDDYYYDEVESEE